jgi:hypothetical protein
MANDSVKKIKALEEANRVLKAENEILKLELKSLKFQSGVNQVLLGYHEQNYASAAADLLIHPSPIKFHATKAGKGVDYMVSLMDVLVVESARRAKIIHLRKPIRPSEGGFETCRIMTDNPKLNFNTLLHSLQKNGHHIIRVHNSFAVNIYHFNLSEENRFVLNTDPPAGFKKSLCTINTDSKFDAGLHHTRLMEIDRIAKHHRDFTINLKKMEEIARYKK